MVSKVLVVDDDDDVREAIVDVLLDAAYRVEVAADGAGALRMLNDGVDPDAVVVDFGLADEAALAIMRACAPSTAVLVISGYDAPDGPAVRHRFLRKPFSGDQLLEELAGMIRARDAP